MSLLIKNGEIVTPDSRCRADIFCEGETITRIGQNLESPPDAEIIDAKGKYVFPGFIDPHVHVYLPFSGTFAKDTYQSASKAALLGGTTCFIDFISPTNKEDLLESVFIWHGKAAGQSACDYTFHMTVPRYDSKAESQLREIVASGIPSFKIYLAYKSSTGLDDSALFHTLKLAKELGVVVAAHCENATIVEELQQQFLRGGQSGPEWHYWTRPPLVEAEGVNHLLTFAELHGTHMYIVHTSCREALEAAARARRRGVQTWIETCIHYLLLDKSSADQDGFEAAKYVISPPLRDKSQQADLWLALRDGVINTLATDHAPTDFATQKSLGKNDFTKITNGVPGIEDRINLLYTYGVCTGKIDLHTFVDVASTQAAKIFGMFPQKGTIQPGSDADLVIYDPNYKGTISAKTHSMNVDYNAYEGFEIAGRPDTVTVRGKVAVRNGKFTGSYTHGQFAKRNPTHF
ncbi:MAG: dihydropyrimidinase [Kiritimatiellia bacterium]